MKKLLLIFAMVLVVLTSGCQKEVEKVPTSNLESYTVDMSGYKNMTSINHKFKGITPKTLLKAIENKESAVIYIGYTGCSVCQDAVSLINEAAINSDITVYYLDCYNETAPLMDYINEVVDVLKPILREDENGEPGIFTPHVFALVNGEYKDSLIGLDDYDGSDKAKEKAIERYQEIMQYFD